MWMPARFLPIALFVTGGLTVFLSLVLSAALPHWWFGFSLPMLSFTGYDPPVCFWIFSIGFTATAFLCAVLGQVEYEYIEKVRAAVGLTTYRRHNAAFRFLMIFAGINLSALAWTDHVYFYKSGFILPHVVTTLAAFTGWLIALQINYKVLQQCSKLADEKMPSSPLATLLQTSVRRKKIGFIALGVCMAIHVPLGYILPWFPLCGDLGGCGAAWNCKGINAQTTRCIPFETCEAETGLSASQCAYWQSESNSSLTDLAAYATCSTCENMNPFTAISQYLLVGALMCMVGLFYFDLSYDPSTGERLVGKGGRKETGVDMSKA